VPCCRGRIPQQFNFGSTVHPAHLGCRAWHRRSGRRRGGWALSLRSRGNSSNSSARIRRNWRRHRCRCCTSSLPVRPAHRQLAGVVLPELAAFHPDNHRARRGISGDRVAPYRKAARCNVGAPQRTRTADPHDRRVQGRRRHQPAVGLRYRVQRTAAARAPDESPHRKDREQKSKESEHSQRLTQPLRQRMKRALDPGARARQKDQQEQKDKIDAGPRRRSHCGQRRHEVHRRHRKKPPRQNHETDGTQRENRSGAWRRVRTRLFRSRQGILRSLTTPQQNLRHGHYRDITEAAHGCSPQNTTFSRFLVRCAARMQQRPAYLMHEGRCRRPAGRPQAARNGIAYESVSLR
jgi:hypothetical protein